MNLSTYTQGIRLGALHVLFHLHLHYNPTSYWGSLIK